LELSDSLESHGFLYDSMELLHFDYVFQFLLMGDLGVGQSSFLL